MQPATAPAGVPGTHSSRPPRPSPATTRGSQRLPTWPRPWATLRNRLPGRPRRRAPWDTHCALHCGSSPQLLEPAGSGTASHLRFLASVSGCACPGPAGRHSAGVSSLSLTPQRPQPPSLTWAGSSVLGGGLRCPPSPSHFAASMSSRDFASIPPAWDLAHFKSQHSSPAPILGKCQR